MANRTVSVGLALDVRQWVSGAQQAIKVTRDFRNELSQAAAKGDLDAVASQATAAGLALTGAFAGIAMTAARFDQAMSSVDAATMTTAANMERLREAALEAGSDTAFSATEAAQGIEELAKAGVDTGNILGGGLRGALDLAAAGQMDVAAAAESAASAMTQFGLSGSDVGHIADLLAAGAGKAQGSVNDMSMALNQSGLVAAQTGLSIEEATGTLAAFASAGLLGSDAGTSFKTMLLRLAAPTDEAASVMAELGISAFDASGNFVGMTRFAGSLEAGLRGMSQQQRQSTLETIFGTDAIRAASIVYEQGADGIQGWIDATNDQGFAAETAARKLDNLMGDIEELTGSLETMAIESGSGANDGLRVLTQTATALVNQFGDLPSAISGTAVVLIGVAGAALLAFAAFVKMRGSAALALAELRAMGPAGAMAAGGLQRAASAGARAVSVFAGLQLAALAADAAFGEELNADIEAMGVGLERFVREGEIAGEVARVLGDDLESLALAFQLVGPEGFGPDVGNFIKMVGSPAEWTNAEGSVRHAREQMDALDASMAQLVQSGHTETAAEAFRRLTEIANENGVSTERLTELMPQYAAALEVAADGGAPVAEGMQNISTTAEAAAEDVEALMEAFNALFGVQMDVDRALIAYRDGLAALDEELREGAATLAINTEEGRENRSAVLDQIDAVRDMRDAWIAEGMGIEEANRRYRSQLGTIEEMLIDLGFNEEAVRNLIGSYRDLPSAVSTVVSTPGLERATAAAETFQRRLDSIDRFVTISFNTVGAAPVNGMNVAQRWGGVVAAQHGRLVPAHVTTSPTVLYGERATGMEAFVPKYGDPARSRAIIAEAASWYGMALTSAMGQRLASAPSGGGQVSLAPDDRALLMAVLDRPIELRTSDEVIARSNDRGQKVIGRRR